MTADLYVPQYYDGIAPGSLSSARAVLPIVRSAVEPSSVLDVGCGVGTWLAGWRELGVEDVFGVDGDYVDRSQLHIPGDRFAPADLERSLRLDRRFDLVMSLEVAEHLSPSAAPRFVESLTSHGDIVLFSAAIPTQGGTHHVNEQWPEYWAALFAGRGYLPCDLVRPRVWNLPEVEFWYAQNVLVYVRADRLDHLPALRDTLVAPADPLALVHPRQFARRYPAPVSRIAPETALPVVADADELIADPSLLRAWVAGGPAGATLIMFAPGGDGGEVESALLAAYELAGIDPDGGPDVVALVVPEEDGIAAIRARARAAYGRRPLTAALTDLPRFGPDNLADLCALAAVVAR